MVLKKTNLKKKHTHTAKTDAPILQANPKAYALPMQIWLLKQRFVTYCQALNYVLNSSEAQTDGCQGVILDRSIFSDVVFAEKNFVDNNFTREGYDFYLELRKRLLASLPLPDAVVYLDAKPSTCAERVKMRSRDCECGIPIEYLEGLDSCYQNFMQDMSKKGTPTLSLPWEVFGNTNEVAETLQRVLRKGSEIYSGGRFAQSGVPISSIKALVQDASAIRNLMTSMPLIDEALGPDAKEAPVADPDVLTKSECVVTPIQSKAHRKRPFDISGEVSTDLSTTVDDAVDTPGSSDSSMDSSSPSSIASASPGEPSLTPTASDQEEVEGIRHALEDAQQQLAF